MPDAGRTARMLRDGGFRTGLRAAYGSREAQAAERLAALVGIYKDTYGDGNLSLFSAPGRTEIGGNHTDHNHGRVLAASIDLDIAAVGTPADDGVIRISSPGHAENTVDLARLEPLSEESGRSVSLVRGLAAAFARRGLRPKGFRACTVSDVLTGSGLSSSAAYESLVGTMIGSFSGCPVSDRIELAIMAREAENRFYGKPSGLMDQLACSVGGLIAVDLSDRDAPAVRQIEYDFSASGHLLCITGPLGSHAGLDAEYASIPYEMRLVASRFGREWLREVSPDDFFAELPRLYRSCPDRALLRAIHFFNENRRVEQQTDALERGDFGLFLSLVRESGRSSHMYLQNIHTGDFQGLALALAESERLLGARGAFRVHGGGFAGTIQAFVPADMLGFYRHGMDRIFGEGSCRTLSIRRVGACKIDAEPGATSDAR